MTSVIASACLIYERNAEVFGHFVGNFDGTIQPSGDWQEFRLTIREDSTEVEAPVVEIDGG